MTRALGRLHRHLGALALIAALATLAPATADAAPRKGVDQTRLLLRLSDLPYGYVVAKGFEGEDGFLVCSTLSPDKFADISERLKRFFRRFHPHSCVTAYERLFTPPGTAPGAASVVSGVMALGSDRAADAAWPVAPELLEALYGNYVQLHETDSGIGVGDASKLFHATSRRFHHLGGRVSGALWRSGNTLAIVGAIGPRPGENDRHATELAQLQQAHIERPTPYTRAERFDDEVSLDDPALKQPIYWLGRDFRPAGLPSIRFEEVETISGTREKTGKQVRLKYGRPDRLSLNLYEWNPHQWKVFQRSEQSRAVVTWKCTQTRIVELPEGTATVYGGYEHDYAACPPEPPTSFFAVVALPGAFVVVGVPLCPQNCTGPRAVHGSFEEVESVVRALTLRPKRFW